jgi:NAD(P)-dependent dehydrogenase (short-subunit alcohol dehydrogenase family)
VRANYVSADLSKVADIEALWLEVTQLYPDGIDILVNNAGSRLTVSYSSCSHQRQLGSNAHNVMVFKKPAVMRSMFKLTARFILSLSIDQMQVYRIEAIQL